METESLQLQTSGSSTASDGAESAGTGSANGVSAAVHPPDAASVEMVDMNAGTPKETQGSVGFWVLIAAALSAGAGAVHFGLAPQHAAEWGTEGLLFAVTGWLQICVAAWMVAAPRSRAPRMCLLAVNLGALQAYLWSRTLGLPFGPLKGVIEDIGWIDGVTALAELVAVVVCSAMIMLSATRRQSSAPGRMSTIAGLVAASLIGASGSAALASSLGQHGHGETASTVDLGVGAIDSAAARQSMFERGERQKQLIAADAVAMAYPTVNDAEKAGLKRVVRFAPGTGAMYFDPKAVAGGLAEFDASKPAGWIFSGNSPESVVVGTVYLVDTADAPVGFAGTTDVWHRHMNVCVVTSKDGEVDLPLPIDSNVLASRCEKAGGVLYEFTPWMLRVWNVPGWQNNRGEFAQDHPDLMCVDGRVSLLDPLKGCAGR